MRPVVSADTASRGRRGDVVFVRNGSRLAFPTTHGTQGLELFEDGNLAALYLMASG